LVAQEVAHSLELSCGSDSYVLAKIDMERAYDKMQWDFIDTVLIHFGFDDRFRMWINGCLSDPTFAVLVNDSSSDFFSVSMGLRQGCPLSLYLFILGSEMLSAGIKQLREMGIYLAIVHVLKLLLFLIFYLLTTVC